MFEDAIRDFARSHEVAYVGDRWRDVIASKTRRSRHHAVSSHMTTDEDRRQAQADRIETAASLEGAVEIFRPS